MTDAIINTRCNKRMDKHDTLILETNTCECMYGITCCALHHDGPPVGKQSWLVAKPKVRSTCWLRGVTALTRAVSGEKQIYSGNLEIFPGIGKHGKFFGKYEIFSGHWAKIWYYTLSNYIYAVICTQCMRCILCILTLENGWTPHDMKRPISNVSN